MKYIYLTLAAAFLILQLFMLPVHADPRGGWNRGHHHGGGWNRYGYGQRYRSDPGTAFWGGVVGGVLGGLFAPKPVVVAPVPEAAGLAPWTDAWYAYCRGKYRSFNPETGRYLGFDGVLHFCQ